MRCVPFVRLLAAVPVVAAEPGDWSELLRSGDASAVEEIDDKWIMADGVRLTTSRSGD